ncbi:uncharacterized protein LOC144160940 [Haemaphysalis longicornis]
MAPTRGKSGQTCCVPGCDNNTVKSPGLSWHKFPNDPALKKVWLKRINRKGPGGKFCLWTPKPSHRICGAHFNKTGRKAYEDKAPRFFPTKTYPEWAQGPPRRCRVSRQPPCSAVTATPVDRQPQEPVVLPELDVASMVTVGPAVHSTSLPEVREESWKPAQPIDHSYSVGQVSPQQAVEEKKRQVAALFETSNTLQAEAERLEEEKRLLKDRRRQLEITVAKCQLQSIEKPVPSNQKSLEILNDPKKLRFYTGFESSQRFILFYTFVNEGLAKFSENGGSGLPTVVHTMDQLTCVLMRLRLGLLEMDLAYRFEISVSSVSRICVFWIEFLAAYLDKVPKWPSRKLIDRFMPEEFKKLYPKTRVILDCTELYIETPSDYATQSATYSPYKHHNTAKGLLGISPNGMVTLVANLAPGRLSDKEVTRRSGLYELLDVGDSVMADRGFLIEEDLAKVGATLNIPPFLKGRSQLSSEDEKKTRQIAKVRIHVERVIGQVKTFRLVKNTFSNRMAHRLNAVWKICTLLCNFVNEPLVDR